MKKKFDCVQMKHDIQRELMKETEGMSFEKRNAYSVKNILANPILAEVWRKARHINVNKELSTTNQ